MELSVRWHNTHIIHRLRACVSSPSFRHLRAWAAGYFKLQLLPLRGGGYIDIVGRYEGEERTLDVDVPLLPQQTVVLAGRRTEGVRHSHPYVQRETEQRMRELRGAGLETLADAVGGWDRLEPAIVTGIVSRWAVEAYRSFPFPQYTEEGERCYWEQARQYFQKV